MFRISYSVFCIYCLYFVFLTSVSYFVFCISYFSFCIPYFVFSVSYIVFRMSFFGFRIIDPLRGRDFLEHAHLLTVKSTINNDYFLRICRRTRESGVERALDYGRLCFDRLKHLLPGLICSRYRRKLRCRRHLEKHILGCNFVPKAHTNSAPSPPDGASTNLLTHLLP